jgi:hypothetical protein
MPKVKVQLLVLAGLALALTSYISASAEPTWISLNRSAIEQKPSAKAQWSNNLETVIEYQITGFFAEEVAEKAETFNSLRFPHYYTTLEIGKPQLPVITEIIGIPGSAEVRATIVDSTVVVLNGYKIHPFQTPLLEGEVRSEFDIDQQLYSQNLWYPERIAEVGEPGIWRDIRVVNLRVCPMRYNPATGELRVYTKLTVKLEHYGISNTNVLAPRQKPISPHQDEMYRSAVLNYDLLDLDRSVKGSKDDYDYLIIASDGYYDEVDTLVKWKNSKGLATRAESLSNIGTTPAAIRDFIITEYDSSNISYVLLVGYRALFGGQSLPTWAYSDIISDYGYALLAGDDNWPEIAVGRFATPVTGGGNVVDSMVSKTIAFEDNPTGEWLKKALLVANWQDAPRKYQQCKEQIKNATDTPTGTYRIMYPTFSTAYGAVTDSGGDEATNQDVIDAINEGRLVVNYRGHGAPGNWCGTTKTSPQWPGWNKDEEKFTTTNASALANGAKTPVVFSIACHNCALDKTSPCLGEAFTKASDGAVAFLGATRASFTNANHTYDKQLFSAIFNEGLVNIGNASNLAAIRIIRQHGTYGLDNARMYLWLGDPSLRLPLDPQCPTFWYVLMDTTSQMWGGQNLRLEAAKKYAVERVRQILQDPDDSIAFATFAGTPGWMNLVLRFDWTRDEDSLVTAIEGVDGAICFAPIADATCAAVDKILNDVPIPPYTNQSRRLLLLTRGVENGSFGSCSGPSDPAPNPPWCDNPNSWQCKVLTRLVDSLVVDVGYFGSIFDEIPLTASAEEREHALRGGAADSLFFACLAETTGGSFYDAADTAICGNGILELGEECDIGYPCAETDPDEMVKYRCIDCQCVPESSIVVIPNTEECVNPGDYVSLPILLDNNASRFGGFELEVEFDYTSMCFVSAERGGLLDTSYTDPDGIFWSWEYFTYRVLPCPIPPCQKYKILLYGQAEIPNGMMNRGVPIPITDGLDTLVLLNFVVMNNENLRGFKIPVCWEWEGAVVNDTLVEDWECSENTFSSASGDTLFTSNLLCQFNPDICDDPIDRIQPVLIFQDGICGQNCGGVDVCPADSAHCKRGDVNMNTVTYEVADAVLFANYFVYGYPVFIHDLAYQICATDVNADGRALTLSDLIYLIRVILHDAVEIPQKLVPATEAANIVVNNNTITADCAAPIAAILFEFDGAVVPTLLADMEMAHEGNKVLVWSRNGNTITTVEVMSFTGEAELVSVSAVDYDTRMLETNITFKAAPATFALPEAMNYSLKIYNVTGQLVRSYEGMGSAGLNVINWDSKDNAGDEVASGLYFYRLTAGHFEATRKMVILK